MCGIRGKDTRVTRNTMHTIIAAAILDLLLLVTASLEGVEIDDDVVIHVNPDWDFSRNMTFIEFAVNNYVKESPRMLTMMCISPSFLFHF